ncbi:hypothetical protein AMTR_s00081p00093950 [Amborella trichopoda]|uniref:Uncharacterized protein n=1 Tax=Amborella trichopoda TaxID=13333 RepID=W1P3P3_AMBTC|nr:hypothetical protein AMTR_s00081p00093950 [Amborella trichopoda]
MVDELGELPLKRRTKVVGMHMQQRDIAIEIAAHLVNVAASFMPPSGQTTQSGAEVQGDAREGDKPTGREHEG